METHVLDSGWQGSFLLNLLVLQDHSRKPLVKNRDTTPFVRGEEAVLSGPEHLTWTSTRDRVGREGLATLLLAAQRSADINLPRTTCIHSLYFGQYPSKPISLGEGVPNGSSFNCGLPSLPLQHIS